MKSHSSPDMSHEKEWDLKVRSQPYVTSRTNP